MPGRSFSSGSGYRYGFNGKENSDEIAAGLTTAMYWEYDSRIGRRWNVEPLEKKYPYLSPYMTLGNNPILFSDPDGKDIIILSAPKGAGGLGHAAVLIGNDKTGWKLYSKNGTYGSSGASGPSNKNPEIGVSFNTLNDFAKSPSNFHEGEVQYTSAFKIITSSEIDIKMKAAAIKQVNKFYDVLGSSCIDVCKDALEAGGLKGEDKQAQENIAKIGGWGNIMEVTPNQKVEVIAKLNKATNATSQILPTEESKKKYKKEYDDYQKVLKVIEDNKPTTTDNIKNWWDGIKSTVSQGIKQLENILSTPR